MILQENLKSRIYVAGHTGMVGSALIRQLKISGYKNFITRTHDQLDLTSQKKVDEFFKNENIDQVFIAAAKVGGIYSNNSFPAEYIYNNIMIQTNIIHAAFKFGIKKLLFLGSSCIYPKLSKQPMDESLLLSGKLEPTNEPYAIAKIAGIKICESYNRQYGLSHNIDYRALMPTNLYGPGDKYDLENSHVIPSLILRFHIAKLNKLPFVNIWGTGKSKREFLFVDDLAKASVHIMNIPKNIFEKNIRPMCAHINVGSGEEITIKELSKKIKNIVGYAGQIKFDENKLEGVKRKLLDSNKIKKLGWRSEIKLGEGLSKTYEEFLKIY